MRLTVQDLEANEWLAEVAARRPTRLPNASNTSRLSVSEAEIKSAFSPVKAKHNLSNVLRGAKKSFASALSHASEAIHGMRRSRAESGIERTN